MPNDLYLSDKFCEKLSNFLLVFSKQFSGSLENLKYDDWWACFSGENDRIRLIKEELRGSLLLSNVDRLFFGCCDLSMDQVKEHLKQHQPFLDIESLFGEKPDQTVSVDQIKKKLQNTTFLLDGREKSSVYLQRYSDNLKTPLNQSLIKDINHFLLLNQAFDVMKAKEEKYQAYQKFVKGFNKQRSTVMTFLSENFFRLDESEQKINARQEAIDNILAKISLKKGEINEIEAQLKNSEAAEVSHEDMDDCSESSRQEDYQTRRDEILSFFKKIEKIADAEDIESCDLPKCGFVQTDIALDFPGDERQNPLEAAEAALSAFEEKRSSLQEEMSELEEERQSLLQSNPYVHLYPNLLSIEKNTVDIEVNSLEAVIAAVRSHQNALKIAEQKKKEERSTLTKCKETMLSAASKMSGFINRKTSDHKTEKPVTLTDVEQALEHMKKHIISIKSLGESLGEDMDVTDLPPTFLGQLLEKSVIAAQKTLTQQYKDLTTSVRQSEMQYKKKRLSDELPETDSSKCVTLLKQANDQEPSRFFEALESETEWKRLVKKCLFSLRADEEDNGKGLYPHDLEATLGFLSGFRKNYLEQKNRCQYDESIEALLDFAEYLTSFVRQAKEEFPENKYPVLTARLDEIVTDFNSLQRTYREAIKGIVSCRRLGWIDESSAFIQSPREILFSGLKCLFNPNNEKNDVIYKNKVLFSQFSKLHKLLMLLGALLIIGLPYALYRFYHHGRAVDLRNNLKDVKNALNQLEKNSCSDLVSSAPAHLNC